MDTLRQSFIDAKPRETYLSSRHTSSDGRAQKIYWGRTDEETKTLWGNLLSLTLKKVENQLTDFPFKEQIILA